MLMTGDGKVRLCESGKPIWNNSNATRPNHPGVNGVSRESDAVVVKARSGEYEFERFEVEKN